MSQFTMVAVTDLSDLIERLGSLENTLARVTVTPAPEWVTVQEAARLHDVTTSTVRRWIAAGRIEAKGSGKARLVRI